MSAFCDTNCQACKTNCQYYWGPLITTAEQGKAYCVGSAFNIYWNCDRDASNWYYSCLVWGDTNYCMAGEAALRRWCYNDLRSSIAQCSDIFDPNINDYNSQLQSCRNSCESIQGKRKLSAGYFFDPDPKNKSSLFGFSSQFTDAAGDSICSTK